MNAYIFNCWVAQNGVLSYSFKKVSRNGGANGFATTDDMSPPDVDGDDQADDHSFEHIGCLVLQSVGEEGTKVSIDLIAIRLGNGQDTYRR